MRKYFSGIDFNDILFFREKQHLVAGRNRINSGIPVFENNADEISGCMSEFS